VKKEDIQQPSACQKNAVIEPQNGFVSKGENGGQCKHSPHSEKVERERFLEKLLMTANQIDWD